MGKIHFALKEIFKWENRNEEIIININAAVKRIRTRLWYCIVGIQEHGPRLIHNNLMILALLHNCLCAIEPDYSVLMPYMRYEEGVY